VEFTIGAKIISSLKALPMSVLYKSLPFMNFKSGQHKAIVAVWYAGILLDELSEKLLEPFGLSLEQFRILHILHSVHPSPVPVYTIRHYMPVRSDLSRTITALNKRELVQKSRSGKDKRVVPVVLTDTGLKLVNDALTKYHNELVSLPVLDEIDAVNAIVGMEKLIDHMQKELRKYQQPK
jgi:DNA-binding MarR family transcriptional regulator